MLHTCWLFVQHLLKASWLIQNVFWWQKKPGFLDIDFYSVWTQEWDIWHLKEWRAPQGSQHRPTPLRWRHNGAVSSQITSLTIVYSTVYSDAYQRKHQSSASLAFVRGIHRRPVNSPHKWPVTRKMFPFDDVIMTTGYSILFIMIKQ